jgi:hypothetical protein
MKNIIKGSLFGLMVGTSVLLTLLALGLGGMFSGWMSGVTTCFIFYLYLTRVEMEKISENIEFYETQRGFKNGKFKDYGGEQCSIQKSSLATQDAIWLGIDNANPQIMSSDAIRMGLKKRTFTEADNGWTPYEIPKEVMLSTRMHLTQKQVKTLLPVLQKFVKTGEI